MANPKLIELAKELGNESEPGEPLTHKRQGNYATLQSIVCTDKDEVLFEQAAELRVAQGVIRDDKHRAKEFTFIGGVQEIPKAMNGWYMPSFALTCGILAKCYEQRDTQPYKDVLDQYREAGVKQGMHATNTIIRWADRTIIHYPDEKDFNILGHPGMNSTPTRKAMEFDSWTKGSQWLANVLEDNSIHDFLAKLTGLAKPELLLDIGRYYGLETLVLFPCDESEFYETKASIGCGGELHRFFLNLSWSQFNPYPVCPVYKVL